MFLTEETSHNERLLSNAHWLSALFMSSYGRLSHSREEKNIGLVFLIDGDDDDDDAYLGSEGGFCVSVGGVNSLSADVCRRASTQEELNSHHNMKSY